MGIINPLHWTLIGAKYRKKFGVVFFNGLEIYIGHLEPVYPGRKRETMAYMDFHACGFKTQSPVQLVVCFATPYHTQIIVCGMREENS